MSLTFKKTNTTELFSLEKNNFESIHNYLQLENNKKNLELLHLLRDFFLAIIEETPEIHDSLFLEYNYFTSFKKNLKFRENILSLSLWRHYLINKEMEDRGILWSQRSNEFLIEKTIPLPLNSLVDSIYNLMKEMILGNLDHYANLSHIFLGSLAMKYKSSGAMKRLNKNVLAIRSFINKNITKDYKTIIYLNKELSSFLAKSSLYPPSFEISNYLMKILIDTQEPLTYKIHGLKKGIVVDSTFIG